MSSISKNKTTSGRPSLSTALFWDQNASNQSQLSSHIPAFATSPLSSQKGAAFSVQSTVCTCRKMFVDYLSALFGFNFFCESRSVQLLNKIFSLLILVVTSVYLLLLIYGSILDGFRWSLLPILTCSVRVIVSILLIQRKHEIIKLNFDMRPHWQGIRLHSQSSIETESLSKLFSSFIQSRTREVGEMVRFRV
jgi:hypothetical protein